ncbi:MAG: acyltransferase [Phycisphaerae bacterium]|nr:acyltransferase [Gemmatimonadaceae bacterium]
MTASVRTEPAPAAKPALVGHLLELDGFRAIAVWLVMLDHMVNGWPLPKEAHSWMPALLWQVISHGWLGVDLFFILSGFLITGILIDARGQPKYFRNFYMRRVLRILPLFYACVAVMYLCYGGPYFLLSLLFLANFAPAFGVSTPHGPGVFWSLAIEEHFYFVWPVFARYMSRNALLGTAIAIVLASPMLRYWAMASGFKFAGVYQYSFYRFDGLALGACLAIWARSPYFNRRGAWMLIALLLGTIGVVTAVTIPYGVFGSGSPMGVALRSTQAQFFFASALIFALSYRGGLITMPLRWSFALFSAKLSYCLYLIHLSIGDLYYWLLKSWDFRDVEHWGPVGALGVRSVAIIGTSFLLAIISQKYLEAPFMRLRRYFA